MKRSVVGTLSAAAALAAVPAAAQVPLTPRALGMANAYVATARGSESLWQNPANLALPGTLGWSFTIPTLSAGADVLGLDLGEVVDIAQYRKQTDERKQQILADVPPGGTEARADVRLPAVSGQIGPFAAGFSFNTVASHTIDRDFVDLLLFGFQAQPGRYNITPQETQGFRASWWDFAVGYGRRLPVPLPGPLTVGATAHVYMGTALLRTGIVRVDTVRNNVGVPQDLQVTYAGVKDRGGAGVGLDLGAAYQPVPQLTLSAAVSNVVNTFNFGGGRSQKQVTLTSADYRTGDLQGVLDRYDASEAEYNEASASANVRALAADLGVDTDLPRTLRAGAALELPSRTTLSAAYQGTLGESRLSGLWEKSLGVGVQQRLAFISARVGASTNLDSGTLLSGGLSLGPLNVALAHITDGSPADADRSGWVASVGFSARGNWRSR
ncbi:DUF5723 family protein [Longimicrobium sp.]|uniref:DUF5723 family protein n=1 Tax=Longimicrobium sp. TaxID=2029185 RepID=UPI002BAE754A|nr:DUF5723 family protein [Longimicrobium sp.]HSU15901.1 DUF5723 family protein [Longimicrobium sp.]